MTQAIGNLGLFAKNFAAKLDEADGKKDNKISASVWNNFVKDKGGKELKYSSYISLENAEKSITQYMYDLHLSSKNSIDNINSEWINTFNKKAEQKAPKKYRIPTADGTPFEKIKLKAVPITKQEKEQGVKSITARYDGERLVDKIYFYDESNGNKIVKAYHDNKRGNVRELVSRGSSSNVISHRGKYENPKSIKIKLPKGANTTATLMAKALEKNKAKLMKLLNIDNKTYDRYAKLTMAIAETETKFGQGCLEFDEKTAEADYSRSKFAGQSVIARGTKVSSQPVQYSPEGYPVGGPNPVESAVRIAYATKIPLLSEGKGMSFGYTSIKIDNIEKLSKQNNSTAKIYKKIMSDFKEMGITQPADLYDPQKCAIATLIYASAHIEIFNAMVQEKQEKNSKEPNAENRLLADNSKNLREEDVVANAWNRGFSYLMDGTADAKSWSYNKLIQKNLNHYNIQS